MYISFKNSPHGTFLRTAIFLWLLPIAAAFSIHCKADQTLSWDSSPNQPINWTSGPANASLGTLADITIAKGYRFTDAAGARDLLQRMKNPVPKGLVGILTPESGQWYAVLTYKAIGYVKVPENHHLNSAAILQTISSRARRQNEERTIHGLPAITSVSWKMPPVYDVKTHTVESAVEAKTGTSDVINQTMRLLGRQGVLDATVVQPYHSGGADVVPLKELIENIAFKPGQRYTDFQKGDTVADIGLAGLIAGTDDSAVAQKSAVAAAAKSAGGWSWYAYVGLGVLVGGSVLFLRRTVRRRHRRARRALTASAVSTGNGVRGEFAHEPAQAVVSAPDASGNGHAAVGLNPNSVKPGDAQPTQPREEVVRKAAAVGNGSLHHHGARRRKIFDYHRFYTDTVMKLSSGAYTEISTGNGRANGNGRLNGRSFGQSVQSQPPTHGDANQALAQAHLDLIANQKDLIEEQKRLMIQQAKLIEEKSKLIAEKSQLLDRQTELFERDVL